MRILAQLVLLALMTSIHPASAQDAAAVSTEVQVAKNRKVYVVTFTEFEYGTDKQNVESQQILNALVSPTEDDKATIVETIRLSTVEGYEGMVQFGQVVSVVVGKVTAGPNGREVKSTQDRQIGTLASFTVKSVDDNLMIDLQFESSRFQGDTDQDFPPPMQTLRIQSSLQAESGQTMLVGGTSAHHYLAVSIAEAN